MVFFKIGFRIYFIRQKEAPHFQNIPPPKGGGIFLNIQLGKNAIIMSITTPRRGVVIDMTSFFLPYDRYRPPPQFFVRKQRWSLAFYKMGGWRHAQFCHAFYHPHIGHQITKHANGFIPVYAHLDSIMFWGWLCRWHDALQYPQWPVSAVSQLYLEGHVLHVYVQLSTPMKKNYTQYYCGHHLAFFAWT